MLGTVYIHSNKEDGKTYVGQSIDINNRWSKKERSYHHNPYFTNALNKYGWDGFDHQIVFQQECTQEELDSIEKIWILVLNSIDERCGYNFRIGGGRGKLSESVKKRISETLKKIPKPVDFGERLSKSITGRKRKPFTEEHKRNMAMASEKRRGPDGRYK